MTSSCASAPRATFKQHRRLYCQPQVTPSVRRTLTYAFGLTRLVKGRGQPVTQLSSESVHSSKHNVPKKHMCILTVSPLPQLWSRRTTAKTRTCTFMGSTVTLVARTSNTKLVISILVGDYPN